MEDDLANPGAATGFLPHHRVERLEQELRDPLGGDGIDHQGAEELRVVAQERLPQGIRLREEAGMVEVVGDPGLQEPQPAEVDDEAALIQLPATELDFDRPVVAMQEGAMTLMAMLPMGERDVAVGLAAGEHGTAGDRASPARVARKMRPRPGGNGTKKAGRRRLRPASEGGKAADDQKRWLKPTDSTSAACTGLTTVPLPCSTLFTTLSTVL